MWLMTPIGFFSIVEKPDDRHTGYLTIRARVRSDLDRLREHCLPSLGPISESTSTDYRYRARASRSAVSQAMAALVDAISYANFKSEVERQQGLKRVDIYHDVWSALYRMQGDAALEMSVRRPAERPAVPRADAYGGVLINGTGQVLLREPANHYDGYVWTFAKGRPDPGETPEQTALREVFEETGLRANIITVIPGVFAGSTTSTVFFLMEPVGAPQPFSRETASIRWAKEAEAKDLIRKTTNTVGARRDLAVLEAGIRAWRIATGGGAQGAV